MARAVLVAGLLGDRFEQLQQINHPSTVKERTYRSFRRRGVITIELSLHPLDHAHIGYQNYKTKPIQDKPRK